MIDVKAMNAVGGITQATRRVQRYLDEAGVRGNANGLPCAVAQGVGMRCGAERALHAVAGRPLSSGPFDEAEAVPEGTHGWMRVPISGPTSDPFSDPFSS